MVYFTSDTHYGHENILSHDVKIRTKFNSLEEHNQAIVDNINSVVSANDILYHLGDWSLGGRDNVLLFREQLNCNDIRLCLGNHDIHIAKNAVINIGRPVNAQSLFSKVDKIIEVKHRVDFVMCHYPIYRWNNNTKYLHLYGHQHFELGYHPRAISVSMDQHPEFRPFSLEEILEIKNKRNEYISNRKESTTIYY